MTLRNPWKMALPTALAVTLVACGGGSDQTPASPPAALPPTPSAPPPASPPPQSTRDLGLRSIYGGSITGVNTQDLIVVIAGDGQLWGLYGSGAAADFRPVGMLRGDGATSSDTRYRASAAYEWGATGSVQTIDLAFDSSIPSISGTVVSTTSSRSVSGGPMLGTGYRASVAATLEAIRGDWQLITAQGRPISLNIDDTGAISGSSGNCTIYDSSVRPSPSGKNLFDVRLQFRLGSFACPEPHAQSYGVWGFALAYSLPYGGKQLVIGAENGWDPVWLAASGKR
jgi:hypothetical protein